MDPADLPDPLAAYPAELTIALPTPIQGPGGPSATAYDKLVLREPEGHELVKVDGKNGLGWTIALVSLVAGVPEPVVGKVPVSYLNAANAYLAVFIQAARKIGAGG